MRAPLAQADTVSQATAFDIDIRRVGPMLHRGDQQTAQRTRADGSAKRAALYGNAVIASDQLDDAGAPTGIALRNAEIDEIADRSQRGREARCDALQRQGGAPAKVRRVAA